MIAALFVLALTAADRPSGMGLKRDAVMDFATCVRRRAPDRVTALLATQPGSKEEHSRIDTIAGAYNACIVEKNILSMSPAVLRGDFAELEFRSDAVLVQKAMALSVDTPILPNVKLLDEVAAKFPAANRDMVFADAFRLSYARCISHVNPQAIAEMVPTEPASAEERAVITKAGEALMHCMPQGITYHLKPAELRPYLMYQLHHRVLNDARRGA